MPAWLTRQTPAYLTFALAGIPRVLRCRTINDLTAVRRAWHGRMDTSGGPAYRLRLAALLVEPLPRHTFRPPSPFHPRYYGSALPTRFSAYRAFGAVNARLLRMPTARGGRRSHLLDCRDGGAVRVSTGSQQPHHHHSSQRDTVLSPLPPPPYRYQAAGCSYGKTTVTARGFEGCPSPTNAT